jgi:transposase InsO family protein
LPDGCQDTLSHLRLRLSFFVAVGSHPLGLLGGAHWCRCRVISRDTAVTFLKAALAYYAGLGIQVKSIMTDNGSCFISHTFARSCADLGLKHIFTRPYTPRTNGNAERFIQTSMREWAYYASYDHSGARLAALAPWLHHYNWHRPHYSLEPKPPASRLQQSPDDLLKLHN